MKNFHVEIKRKAEMKTIGTSGTIPKFGAQHSTV